MGSPLLFLGVCDHKKVAVKQHQFLVIAEDGDSITRPPRHPVLLRKGFFKQNLYLGSVRIPIF